MVFYPAHFVAEDKYVCCMAATVLKLECFRMTDDVASRWRHSWLDRNTQPGSILDLASFPTLVLTRSNTE
jgi:hypothetical protein